ncbi:hypothetical protein BGZ73_008551, partial [Actinomortierella ambigua]
KVFRTKMKFTPLLISAALALVASAAPVSNVKVDGSVNLDVHNAAKRCVDCTATDSIALDLIIKSTADHYSDIAATRLDLLNTDIQSAKVTSGSQELTQEKAALTITVQSKIDAAKKACSSDELAPVIKATVTSDSSMDIAWSQQSREEIEKKMVALDATITRMILDRIQSTINADTLSKECTENMTNTEITPAPVDSNVGKESTSAGQSAPGISVDASLNAPIVGGTSDSSKATDATGGSTGSSVIDTPASASGSQPCEDVNGSSVLKPGIDIAASVDSKYVCAKGCTDTEDATNVLTLRVSLEKALAPRIDHVVQQEIPTDCNEKRDGLLDNIVDLLKGLKVEAQNN